MLLLFYDLFNIITFQVILIQSFNFLQPHMIQDGGGILRAASSCLDVLENKSRGKFLLLRGGEV